MKLVMRKIYAFLLAVLAISACETADPGHNTEFVDVVLSFECGAAVKADSPLIPDVENLIYDVWVLQYDKMGLLIDAGTSHSRAMASGSLTAEVNATLAVGDGCTLCVLANLDRGVADSPRVWPQTLTEFKNSPDVVDISADIDAANAGTLTDMPMSGYWEGNITSTSKDIQVSLGRMMSRINLVINNGSSSSYTVNSISNVSRKVYAFPSVTHDPLPADAYAEIAVNQSVAAGAVKEMYFYMAPNFNDATGAYAVRLNIGGKSPVILANGAPSDSPRDYNLYHNSNYTFTINLK